MSGYTERLEMLSYRLFRAVQEELDPEACEDRETDIYQRCEHERELYGAMDEMETLLRSRGVIS